MRMIMYRRGSRGVSLVEAMVALAVMAFGMLAVVGVQSTLRLNADIAKQRSEATRIAQETVEDKRAFTVIDVADGPNAWAAIADNTRDVTVGSSNTTYQVQTDVVTYADPPAKALLVTVRWHDRAGQPQQVAIRSAIAAAAPGLSGTLAIRPGTAAVAPVRRPFKRHPSIPVQARDFGGSSAFVPPFRPWMAIVFDNISGLVTGICNFNHDTSNTEITTSDIASCSSNTVGQLLSGFVRFVRSTTTAPLSATDVENPLGPALNIRLQIALTSSNHPTGSFCIDDANTFTISGNNLPFATYFCVIMSNSAGLWSGTTTVVSRNSSGPDAWEVSGDISGTGPGADRRFRVCRYTSATTQTQNVPNQDHPRNYADVAGNLTDQNFVVIPSEKLCPTDVPANPANGDFINSNTLQQQPTAS